MKYKQKLKDGTQIIIDYDPDSTEAMKLISYIQSEGNRIAVFRDSRSYLLNLSDICYFEVVDSKVFVYTDDEVYEIRSSLNELIDSYSRFDFIRISKQLIVNIHKIKQLKTELNGRIRIILENNEALIISRHYASAFRKRLEG